MAAMYIGSAVGSAAGTLILHANAHATVLPGWALIASIGALIIAVALTVALQRR
jgi:predicted MFS family arabinose efflux permease